MIKPPSLQADFTLIYSEDPALSLPEDADERARVLKTASETGHWPLIDGEKPTLFHFHDLSRQEISWIYGEQGHSSVYGRPLSAPEFTDLIFRVAIRKVDNFGEHKIARARTTAGIWLADAKIVDVICRACGPGPIVEFASIVLKRAEGVRPLS